MKLEKKQKILLTLVIIAFAYLAWQLYDIFFANKETPTAEITPITTQPGKLQAPLTGTTSTMPSIAPAATTQPPVPTIPATNKITTTTPGQAPQPTQPVMRQMSIQAPMTQQQMRYLRLVNQYQIVRMQRLVADEEAAMYASRAKIAELHQQIAKTSGTSYTATSTFGAPMPSTSIGYQLMYIDYQNGQWTATLNQSGRFIEVNCDTVLPDGARILKITQNGVVIRKWNKNYLLSFYGTTVLNSNPPLRPVFAPKPSYSNIKPISYSLPATTQHNNLVGNSSALAPAQQSSQQSIVPTPAATKPVTGSPLPTISNATATPVTPTMQNSSTAPMPAAAASSVIIPAEKNELPGKNPAANLSANEKKDLVLLKPVKQKEKKPLPSLEKNLKNTPLASTTPSKNLKTPLKPESDIATKNIAPSTEATATTSLAKNDNSLSTVALIPPKKEVPLTLQQKNTVTQLETYLDHKNTNPESYSSDEKHLLTLPAESYTLQIMGSYRLSDLLNFIRANNLRDKAFTFHTFYMDKDWYVLIYGAYKTESEALNAINSLPPAVQRLKPWVRTIGSVHEAIKINPKRD